jgi:hypothetical protein
LPALDKYGGRHSENDFYHGGMKVRKHFRFLPGIMSLQSLEPRIGAAIEFRDFNPRVRCASIRDHQLRRNPLTLTLSPQSRGEGTRRGGMKVRWDRFPCFSAEKHQGAHQCLIANFEESRPGFAVFGLE